MVVIGGTALTGGRGTIIGTVLGIFILRVMRNGIVLIGVPGLAYNIFIGAIILGMMALHSGSNAGTSRGPKAMAEELIRMENISKFYGRVQALDDVTLHVNENEIVGLLGDNGAGKSTLIKVLSGAVPADQRRHLHPRQEGRASGTPPTRSPTASRRSTRTPRWSRSSRSRATCSSAASRSRVRASSTAWTRRRWTRSRATC